MPNFISQRKKLIPVLTVALFFAILVLVGFLTYKDYGVSSDEEVSYTRGRINYKVFRGGSLAEFYTACSKLKNENSCYYPPLFDMVLYRLVPEGDSQSVFERLHLVRFLFFAGAVFVFFFIGKKVFKHWLVALAGCLLLVLSPRIFGHAFFNPKDLPFMDAYVLAMATLLLFLEKKNLLTALLHGLAVGIACSIRTPGLVLIPITVFFYGFDLFLAKKPIRQYWVGLGLLGATVTLAALLVYWFTPMLYGNPIANFIKTFNIMKAYPIDPQQLYLGQDNGASIPWHYSLVWFAISSPPFYVALFVLGGAVLAARSLRSLPGQWRERFQALRDMLVVAACGLAPILVVILFKSLIYPDNRQMYFVYPALLLVSVYGLRFLVEKIREVNLHWRAWTAVILLLGLAYPLYFMVRYHTYENVFFNFLAGPNMSTIARRFTMDRWCMAGKNALEYIIRTDPDPVIPVRKLCVVSARLILPASQRNRFRIMDPPKYYLSNDLYVPSKKNPGTVYYTVKVFDADILTVVRYDMK